MGIFTRFKDIVTANVNSMLDKAEDPEKMIRLMIREMEETLVELKASCAGTMADCKRLARELSGVQAVVERWEERAELAIDKGREDLAREALLEKRKEEDRSLALEREVAGCEALVSQAQEDIRVLEEKLRATKEKQGLLVKRHQHATVRKQAHIDARKADAAEAIQRFEELEQRVERMEADAEVEGIGRHTSLNAKFAELEGADKVEEELQALKKRMAEKK